MAHATKSLPDSDDKIDAAAGDSRDMAMIVVTVDHVYLPLDEDGNGRADWAVTSDATTRVARGTRLRVPTDLALHLVETRKQAVLK